MPPASRRRRYPVEWAEGIFDRARRCGIGQHVPAERPGRMEPDKGRSAPFLRGSVRKSLRSCPAHRAESHRSRLRFAIHSIRAARVDWHDPRARGVAPAGYSPRHDAALPAGRRMGNGHSVHRTRRHAGGPGALPRSWLPGGLSHLALPDRYLGYRRDPFGRSGFDRSGLQGYSCLSRKDSMAWPYARAATSATVARKCDLCNTA